MPGAPACGKVTQAGHGRNHFNGLAAFGDPRPGICRLTEVVYREFTGKELDGEFRHSRAPRICAIGNSIASDVSAWVGLVKVERRLGRDCWLGL
jgi:hypothetical protein